MRRALGIFAAAIIWPSVANACAVCFSATDSNRMAFLITTIVLSFLPLSLIVGGLLWLRKRYRQVEAEEAALPEQVDGSAERA